MASPKLDILPTNVSVNLSVAPAIPAVLSVKVFSIAFLNSGNVNVVKSSILLNDLTKFNIPFSLNLSAAPIPPAKALPIAFAASVTVGKCIAAKSVTGFIIFSASTPKASKVCPACTTSCNANGVVAATF